MKDRHDRPKIITLRPTPSAEGVDRRSFLRKSGAAFAFSAFSLGCGEDGFSGPVGSARIRIAGLTGNEGGTLYGTSELGTPVQKYQRDMPAPASGVSEEIITGVPIGIYRVGYHAPDGHQVVVPAEENGEHLLTVEVFEGLQAEADFVVQESITGPPPVGLIFASDWSTGLGTTDAVLRDTGKSVPWTNPYSGVGGEVIQSTGLNFPSTNVLRMTCLEERTGFFRLVKSGLPPLPIGGTRFHRWYFRAAWPDNTSDPNTHPIEDDLLRNWAMGIEMNNGGPGHWQFAWNVSSDNGFGSYRWWSPILDKNITYRMEMALTRLTTTTMRMRARMFVGSDQVAGDEHFVNQAGDQTLAQNPALIYEDPVAFQGIKCGNNGLTGTNWFPAMLHSYQGCFAISDADWCGPYVPGEAVTPP